MTSHARLSDILKTLEGRLRTTRDVFTDLTHSSALPALVGAANSWAIVGGAVRDTVLTEDPRTPRLFRTWPDIDIAVTVDLRTLPIRTGKLRRRQLKVSPNQFGGMKVREKALGVLDVWSWIGPGAEEWSLQDWLRRLDYVDFGLNAIAFVWPHCQVILHARWRDDLRRRLIEKLAKHSPRREVQPIRALALALKTEELVGEKVKLGKEIEADLQWLLTKAGPTDVKAACRYLKEKTDSNRWPKIVLDAARKYFSRYECSEDFRKAASDVLGDWFGKQMLVAEETNGREGNRSDVEKGRHYLRLFDS